ncbi:hypothetical protein [Cytobacillus sp. IB215316]|uniref:hypothetical protein n=1 Tax=Cytobacillus sp. IB215316 TaxID=3097354 RepID=UPI002A0DAE34|nr:hypothetical protein [Cytobacillus sp. IB215316]MDX8360745.1 hypothetical protein [Cytobacillus sp. IB215316]
MGNKKNVNNYEEGSFLIDIFDTVKDIITLLFKVAVFLITAISFIGAYANTIVVISALLQAEWGNMLLHLFTVFFFILIIFILSKLRKATVVFTLEFFIFGNAFGFPNGITFISLVPLITLITITDPLLNIELNLLNIIVYLAVSIGMAIPVFSKFSKWYFARK